MEDTVEVITIEMNGNEYFLVDSVKFKNETYHFFCNINNNEEIQVMKDEKDGEEMLRGAMDYNSYRMITSEVKYELKIVEIAIKVINMIK